MSLEINNSLDNQRTAELCRQLGKRLISQGWRLATAESCTGGWISQLVTSLAGSSDWFECGLVTYSNEAKQALLKVPREFFEGSQAPGAVSSETVEAMALGALAVSKASFSIATSGIAGPAGGTTDKPVGTVWIAWAFRGGKVTSRLYMFEGDREAIRAKSVTAALQEALRLLAVAV